MRINKTITVLQVAALAGAALCLGSSQVASAQVTDQGTTAPGTSTVPSPTPPPTTVQPPAPAPAAPTAPASTAPAPTPTATPRLTYSGLIDAYYLYQFNNPKHLTQNALTSSAGVNTPAYDTRHNTPTLALAELNIVYAVPSDGGFGAKATLMTGDVADMNHGGLGVDPNVFHEAYYKNIQQLYVTYASKSGAGVDFGKFYTPFGYEVTESNANYNYSRSVVFWYLLPIYHFGFRAYTPNMKGLTLTGWIVNSLNSTSNEGVHDDNSDKGYIGQVNYTDPKGRYVAIDSLGYSKDKFAGGYTTDKTTVNDLDLTWTPNPVNTFGFEWAYRKDDGSSEGHLVSNGYAVFYRNQLNARNAAALRYSYVNQRAFGRPWEITGTYEIKSSARFLTRLEYRYDHIYGPGFGYADSSGAFTKSSQNTASVSEVFTF